MPPKQQPKADLAKKQKQVEDKTFGLKNIQKYVQSLKQSIASKLAAKKKKDEEEAELNENKIKLGCCERLILFKQAISHSQPKVPVGVDPKSILCEFFKAGQCQKGFKCKFSHDLNIQRKGEKMDIYSDKRDEDGTMEEWDQATLEKVVESKKNEYNQNKQTDIVCKYFLDAVEKKQYGWFWACPNGGKECHYRHALPPGYILKSQMKALLEEESQIEEEIENERSKLKTSTQMTPALIMECKRKKIAERDAGLAAERAKKDRMSGRELFLSNASLFVDDAEACEEYEREREEEEIEHTSSCPMQISDLPEELESEILCRIPATNLSQLRSTCKRWYALFKDPRFVKKNLGKAAAMQLILKKDDMIYSGIIDIHGICNDFDPSIEFKGQKDSEHVKITEISLCGGLLLCTTKDKRLVVWNPCTGQTRWIQYRGNISCNYLGYEKNNSNYKILSSVCIRFNDQTSVAVIEIYEFKSDSWRFLDDITNHWYGCLLSGGGGVSIKGNTYWFDKLKVDHPFNSIIVFDFTTERLERLSLPFQSSSSSYNDETVVLSSVREEKLAVLRRRNDLDSLKIWVADTKIDDETKDLSWREILVVDFSKLDIKFPVGFLLDEENKMVVFCDNENANNFEEGNDRIRIQIVGENIHKEIINESVHDYGSLLLSYVPSLIQIQQATTGG